MTSFWCVVDEGDGFLADFILCGAYETVYQKNNVRFHRRLPATHNAEMTNDRKLTADLRHLAVAVVGMNLGFEGDAVDERLVQFVT